MLNILGRSWGLLVLRGVIAIVFGVAAILMPLVTLSSLVLVFGAFCFADGVFAVIGAFRGRGTNEDWWLVLLQGVAGLLIGAFTLVNPALTALALLIYIAAWSLITGILQLVAAIKLRKEIKGELWLGLSGLLSIGFAFLLIWRPEQGALALILVIGAWAIAVGVLLVIAGFEVRTHHAAAAGKPAQAAA